MAKVTGGEKLGMHKANKQLAEIQCVCVECRLGPE